MPHHVHFIAVVPEGKTIGWLMSRVKSNAARRILPLLDQVTLGEFDQQRGLNGRSFWQRSFRSFVLTSEDGFLQKVRYIHDNPVRSGLVESAPEYRWSSARMFEEGRWREDGGLMAEASEFAALPRWVRTAPSPETDRNPQPLALDTGRGLRDKTDFIISSGGVW